MRPSRQRLFITFITRAAAAAAPALLLTLMLLPGATRLSAQAPAPAPAPAPAANDDVVTMDTLEVNATRFHWTHAQSTHFEILSNLDDAKFVAEVVRQAEPIITLYESACPAVFSPRFDLPSKLIFIQDEMIERLFAQANIGATQADLNERMAGAPFHKNGAQFENRYKISAFAKHNDEQLVIVKFLSKAYMLNGQDWHNKSLECAADLAVTYLDECVRIYAKGKKLPWLVAALNGMRGHPGGGTIRLPRDFSSNVYGTQGRFTRTGWIGVSDDKIITLGRYCLFCEIDATKATIDYPLISSDPKKEKTFWQNFMLSPDISLGDVLNNTFDSPELVVADTQRQLAMQREVRDFLYYCLFGPNHNMRRAFADFVGAVVTQPIDERLFINCFGAGYDEFRDKMYASFKIFTKKNPDYERNPWGMTGISVTLPPAKTLTRFVKLTPSQRADTARLIGDWFDVCDAPAGTRNSLLKTYDASPQAAADPQFIATLALNEARCGDRAKAIALLEKAASAKITRPRVYRTLSRLYLEDILVRKGADYRLAVPELRDILVPLANAFSLPQPNPKNYIIFSDAWAHTDIDPNKAYRDTIIDGCQRFSDNIDMLETILPAFAKRGFKLDAIELAEQSEQNPLPPEKKQQLDKLLENLRAE